MPVLVTFVLTIIVGTSYAFTLVLYFIVLVPMVLFNLMEVHKKIAGDNKILFCIL
jgi:hypothetical protein